MKMKNFIKVFLVCIVASMCYSVNSYAVTEPLTDDQRREYLHYYSPIIFKRADESTGSEFSSLLGSIQTFNYAGHDIISNYYFDGDQNFSNNRYNWRNNLAGHILDGSHSNWSIRPTLYTSLIEYMDGDQKNLILLYNIYHPRNGLDQIHDWERIEIRVNDVKSLPSPNSNNEPGKNDYIPYAVITEHHKHSAREGDEDISCNYEDLKCDKRDMNFQITSQGRHLMVYQAEWSETGGLTKGELHWVEDTFAYIEKEKGQNDTAKVDINGYGRKGFHYVFVDPTDTEAASYWGAQTISQANAKNLYSGMARSSVSYSKVNSINFELQDIADIIVTNATINGIVDHSNYDPSVGNCDELNYNNWYGAEHQIKLSTPINDEFGNELLGVGDQQFRKVANDCLSSAEDKKGFPAKSWFWGMYDFGRKGNDNDGDGWDVDKHFQHNFVVHEGSKEYWNKNYTYLKDSDDWYLQGNGGFDGRWVQLFTD